MSNNETKVIRIILQVLLVALILAAGIGVFKKMMASKKPPAKKGIVLMAPLINAKVVHSGTVPMKIHGFGTVKEKVSAQIVPQVAGKVTYCNENFVDGGFFKAGEKLITIDKRDYQSQLESAQAAVAKAQVMLDKEKAEAAVARKEWKQLHPDTEPTSPLVLRKPQIRDAESQLKAAIAKRDIARLNLERTEISMPFDGRVVHEAIDIGQYLAPGKSVATVYGIDTVEIIVPIEDRELEWFDVPMNSNGNKTTHKGAAVTVRARFAGKNHNWDGNVVRCQGQIDPATRMVNMVIEVLSPFRLSGDRPPLVPGMFVEVEIHGRQVDNVVKVPRQAVRNGREVWIAKVDENSAKPKKENLPPQTQEKMAKDIRLNIQQIKIIRSDTNYSYITSGIEDGDVVVTGSLDAVTDGMAVRVNMQDK